MQCDHHRSHTSMHPTRWHECYSMRKLEGATQSQIRPPLFLLHHPLPSQLFRRSCLSVPVQSNVKQMFKTWTLTNSHNPSTEKNPPFLKLVPLVQWSCLAWPIGYTAHHHYRRYWRVGPYPLCCQKICRKIDEIYGQDLSVSVHIWCRGFTLVMKNIR